MLKHLISQSKLQLAFVAICFAFSAQLAFAQTAAFSYQGRLTDTGNPANGNYDLQFRLFDALVGGTQVGLTVIREDVVVTGGIFTVPLDFGAAAFPGANRWLEIGVRPGISTGVFTALSPLQPITATPYALQSLNATNATNAVNATNATNATTAINFSGALTGDVTGTQGATTVAKLRGRTVASTAPLTGQVLKFNSTTNQWEPDTDNISAGGGGTITGVTPGTGLSGGGASGNVTLNIANGGVGTAQLADNNVTDAKIVSLSGGKITGAVANATNAATATNATNATNAATAANFSGALAGDVTGNQGTTTVGKLRNLPLPAPVLADDGKVLRYKNDGVNPASFELAAVSGGGTLTGVTAGTGLSGGGTSGTVTVGLAPGGVSATELAANAVTTAKLADGSVTDAKIATVAGSKVTGAIPVAGVPAGSTQYIQNTATLQASSNFNISGNGFIGGNLGVGTTDPGARLDVQSDLFHAIYGVSNTRNGVVGSSRSKGTGVAGSSDSGTGVSGSTTSGTGVAGNSNSGRGVEGYSASEIGVYGQSDSYIGVSGQSNSHNGVFGSSTSGDGVAGGSTSGIGVEGYSISGRGVQGYSVNNSGVYGTSGVSSLTAAGVFGYGSGSGSIGVIGESNINNAVGVFGVSTSSIGVGVYGRNTGGGFAGVFEGKVAINGVLQRPSEGFKIDHPLDPENKYLTHSSVESPEMKNLYDGTVTTDAQGEAEITLPDWFAALNRDFRYQLTCIGVFAQAIIAAKIKDNRFKIKTSLPNVEVSWQVTGTRQDAWAKQNRLPVEELKPEVERGSYQNPSAFGQPEEKSIEWARDPVRMKQLKEQQEGGQRKQNNNDAAPAMRPNHR